MRTRKGIVDTLTGILITKIKECAVSDSLARSVAEYIIDYFVEEENLVIPSNNGLSSILYKYEMFLKTVDNPDIDNEHIYRFITELSKESEIIED